MVAREAVSGCDIPPAQNDAAFEVRYVYGYMYNKAVIKWLVEELSISIYIIIPGRKYVDERLLLAYEACSNDRG